MKNFVRADKLAAQLFSYRGYLPNWVREHAELYGNPEELQRQLQTYVKLKDRLSQFFRTTADTVDHQAFVMDSRKEFGALGLLFLSTEPRLLVSKHVLWACIEDTEDACAIAQFQLLHNHNAQLAVTKLSQLKAHDELARVVVGCVGLLEDEVPQYTHPIEDADTVAMTEFYDSNNFASEKERSAAIVCLIRLHSDRNENAWNEVISSVILNDLYQALIIGRDASSILTVINLPESSDHREALTHIVFEEGTGQNILDYARDVAEANLDRCLDRLVELNDPLDIARLFCLAHHHTHKRQILTTLLILRSADALVWLLSQDHDDNGLESDIAAALVNVVKLGEKTGDL